MRMVITMMTMIRMQVLQWKDWSNRTPGTCNPNIPQGLHLLLAIIIKVVLNLSSEVLHTVVKASLAASAEIY